MKQKYYLRGLGFGILITALVMFVGSSEMSEEEIIQYAEQLGYVKEESSIKLKDLLSGTPAPTSANIPEAAETLVPESSEELEITETPLPELSEEPKITGTPAPTPTNIPEAAETPVLTGTPAALGITKVTATIVVEPGNSASVVCSKIEEAGILADGDLLKKYLAEQNLEKYINIGTYTLSNEMTVTEIAAILTGR